LLSSSGERCPLDKFDETLEAWKEISGAQKCPACFKLIEKDDPDTCNHMVHKITDGIPCIHDRTDFCYLCGELVTADYPHDEVRNPGVNHFPDGVFQKCRIITAKEREVERDRLRKIRRMKIKKADIKQKQKRNSQTNFVVAGNTDGTDNWDTETDPLFATAPLTPTPEANPAIQPQQQQQHPLYQQYQQQQQARADRPPARARRRRPQGSRESTVNEEFAQASGMTLTAAALRSHNSSKRWARPTGNSVLSADIEVVVAAPVEAPREYATPVQTTGTLQVFDDQWDFELNHRG
jgi:hypothetical protein